MKAYRKRIFEIGDEKRLRYYQVFPDLTGKTVDYELLINEIVENPELISNLKDKPFAKDVIVVFEACLRNSKVKEFSNLYQYNIYLQYLVTKYENEILKDGKNILFNFAIIKNMQFSRSKGKNPYYYGFLKKIATISSQRKWKKEFLKDNPSLCYLATEDDSFKTFKLKRKREFTNRVKTKYSNLISKSIEKFNWKTSIDVEQIQPILDDIYREYEIEYFDKKLTPIIKEVFGEDCSKETYRKLLTCDAERIEQMAISGII